MGTGWYERKERMPPLSSRRGGPLYCRYGGQGCVRQVGWRGGVVWACFRDAWSMKLAEETSWRGVPAPSGKRTVPILFSEMGEGWLRRETAGTCKSTIRCPDSANSSSNLYFRSHFTTIFCTRTCTICPFACFPSGNTWHLEDAACVI